MRHARLFFRHPLFHFLFRKHTSHCFYANLKVGSRFAKSLEQSGGTTSAPPDPDTLPTVPTPLTTAQPSTPGIRAAHPCNEAMEENDVSQPPVSNHRTVPDGTSGCCPCGGKGRSRRHRLDAHFHCPGTGDAARAGTFLRRDGPRKKRPFDQHAYFCGNGHHWRAMGGDRLQSGLRWLRPLYRRTWQYVSGRHWPRQRNRHHSNLCLCHVPGHVRHYHPGPHFRRRSRTHEIFELLHFHIAVGHPGIRSAGPLGLG